MGLEICLFSPEGKDENLTRIMGSITQTEVRYLCLSDNLGASHLVSLTRDTNSTAHLFPRSKLASWSPAVATLLLRDIRQDTRKVFIDVDFALAHKVPMAAFLARAATHDFYSLSGRFDREDHNFAFPTWECCSISSDLWNSHDFKTFIANISTGLNLDGRLHVERSFYESFHKSFDFASIVGTQTSRHFDPVGKGRISLAKLLGQDAEVAVPDAASDSIKSIWRDRSVVNLVSSFWKT
tara:strand:- start:520 stop:1236 length:717 start_codon:yes stop_codon:yes gene_type:complete